MTRTSSLLLYIAFILLTSTLQGQDHDGDEWHSHTLFGSHSGVGGYLGINNKLGTILDQDAYYVGGEVAVVISHGLNLGFEGYGLLSPIESAYSTDSGEPYYIQMGYGGLHLEPVVWSESVLHLSIPVMLGAGGVAETLEPLWTENDQGIWVQGRPRIHRSDLFLVAEGGLNAELNVFKFMRVIGGVSYRMASELDQDILGSGALDGLQYNLGLRFGWF